MAAEDRQRWDERHRATEESPVPAPPDALRGREHVLPRSGRALDVACGRGAVAVWLARRGLQVDAVDVSPVALKAAAALAQEHGVAERVWFVEHDLDEGLPDSCRGPYDLIVCQRFRDPDRYPQLAAALAPGGLLVITVLSEVGAGPGRFRARPGELRAAFGDLEVLVHHESDGEASLVARRPSTAS